MTRSTRRPHALLTTASALVTAVVVSTALAQPPETPPGPPEGGPPPGHRDPLRAALDANHDFELDADEIAKAPDALKKLDTNGDGTIDREELRPPLGPPPGRGPGDRGFEGRPRGPGDVGGRPPREGRDGPPPRDDASPEDRPRPPREGFRPGGGPPGDRPSPERFLERAKEFDADGDGKLDEGELTKMVEAMAERMRAGRAAGGPPRDGDGDDRPERPRRPE